MTITNPEQVSMLVDGELDEHQLPQVMAALKSDAELKSCWARYHLIGDAVRKNLPSVSHRDFAERVARAVQNEPAYLGAQTPVRPSRKNAMQPVRHALGFALAASITALAVVGLMQFDQPSRPALEVAAMQPQGGMDQPFGTAAHSIGAGVVADSPAAGGFGAYNVAFREADLPAQQFRVAADDLYDFLVNYQQYALAAEHGEMLSYIRYASHAPY